MRGARLGRAQAFTLAVPTAGFATFLNLYSPQALLPRLSHEFNVSAGEISACPL